MSIKVYCPVCGGLHYVNPGNLSTLSDAICSETCVENLKHYCNLGEISEKPHPKSKYLFCENMRVKIELTKPYTQKELNEGCSNEVDNQTGTINYMSLGERDGINALYEIALDKPILSDNLMYDGRYYNEYAHNLEPIGQDGWEIWPTSCSCGGNLAWVYTPPDRATRMFGCVCHNHPPFNNKELMENVMKNWGLAD